LGEEGGRGEGERTAVELALELENRSLKKSF